MIRKDFKLIAAVMAEMKPNLNQVAIAMWRATCLRFSQVLHSTNPAFDSNRFLSACDCYSKGKEKEAT